MRINGKKGICCLALLLALLLTSCDLFARNRLPQKGTPNEPIYPDVNTPPVFTPDENPVMADPTPLELIADLVEYSFGKTALTVAVSENCMLFAEGTDSNAVLTTVLEAIKKKYKGSVAFGEYGKNHLYLGVKDMVEKGSATAYFSDMLILPATEFFRYKNDNLLERLETIPFLDTYADCFDATLTDLFRDESGTYGVVGYGSQLFKNQIVVFFNPELLAKAKISFDGYSMVDEKTWDFAALADLAKTYTDTTGETAVVSDLSEDMTEKLFAVLTDNGELGFSVDVFDEDGKNAFLMGRAPILIGVLGDVELMPTARDLYGMLPIPYVQDGAYETFYDMDSVYVFCVPKGNDRTDCTGLFLQAYHTASQYLPYSYFSQWLMEKYVRDEGTLRMIALVGQEARHLPEMEVKEE